MRKSASVKNFVLLIRVMLWERVRSRYGMSVLSGRYGCRTWLELVLTRWKKSSSAVSNKSATVGTCLRSTRVVCHDAAAIQDARDQQPNTFLTRLAPRTESGLLLFGCLIVTYTSSSYDSCNLLLQCDYCTTLFACHLANYSGASGSEAQQSPKDFIAWRFMQNRCTEK